MVSYKVPQEPNYLHLQTSTHSVDPRRPYSSPPQLQRTIDRRGLHPEKKKKKRHPGSGQLLLFIKPVSAKAQNYDIKMVVHCRVFKTAHVSVCYYYLVCIFCQVPQQFPSYKLFHLMGQCHQTPKHPGDYPAKLTCLRNHNILTGVCAKVCHGVKLNLWMWN